MLEAEALFAQGDIARVSGQRETALKHFAAAKEIAAAAGNPELHWRSDFGRGQALEALNQNKDALAAYEEAVKSIEQVRSELSEERFRAGYIEDKYQVYVALVQLLLKMGKTDEAFFFSEKLRARSYLDLLSRGQPPIRNDAQRQKESVLRNRIRELQRKLEEESGKPSPERRSEAFDLFSKELSEAEREYEAFLDDLLSTDPNYAATRTLKVPTRAEVKHQLSPDTALIEYVVAVDSLESFVLTANGLRAKSLPFGAPDLQTKIEFLRDVLLRKNTDEWKLPARSLYQILIGPIEDAGWLRSIKNIYIVPHSVLHYLPFAVLAKSVRTASGSERITDSSRASFSLANDSQPSLGTASISDRLLIDDYILAYLPAAAALVYGGKGNAASTSMLAMAPASTRLRYAQQESQNVSAFYPRAAHVTCRQWRHRKLFQAAR